MKSDSKENILQYVLLLLSIWAFDPEVPKRKFKRNQRERKEQKRNDAGSSIAFSACRSDDKPEQRRQEPPEDFSVFEGNSCCDAPE